MSKILVRGLAGLLGLMLFLASASSVHAVWYNANWQYRERLTIDYTKVAASLSSSPVLDSLTSGSDPVALA